MQVHASTDNTHQRRERERERGRERERESERERERERYYGGSLCRFTLNLLKSTRQAEGERAWDEKGENGERERS